jgi:hypothetical protein
VVGVYVNDLLIVGPMDDGIDKFKQEMREQFKMSNLESLTYCLEIEVCQNSAGISLCENAYAQRLLEKMGLADCNPSHTPMEARLQLIKTSSEAQVDATQYRSVVGH